MAVAIAVIHGHQFVDLDRHFSYGAVAGWFSFHMPVVGHYAMIGPIQALVEEVWSLPWPYHSMSLKMFLKMPDDADNH